MKPATCAKTHKLRNSKKHLKQSPKSCKRLMGLFLAANKKLTSKWVQAATIQYAPRLPQHETKSSTKQLAPTNPILDPENFSKPASLKKGLP